MEPSNATPVLSGPASGGRIERFTRGLPPPSTMKIRRSSELPSFAQEELGRPYQYPHRPTIRGLPSDVSVRFRRSRKKRIGGLVDGIRRSEFFAWVHIGPRPVSALRLVTYDVTLYFSDDDFLNNMDMDASEDYTFANVIAEHWTDVATSLSAYGPLVQFCSAWADPQVAGQNLWWKVANHLLFNEMDRWSVLVLKAFPLEYDGNVPDGSASAPFFAQRQRAMVRYYGRTLGMTALPRLHGREGWLYRFHPELREVLAVPVERDEAQDSASETER